MLRHSVLCLHSQTAQYAYVYSALILKLHGYESTSLVLDISRLTSQSYLYDKLKVGIQIQNTLKIRRHNALKNERVGRNNQKTKINKFVSYKN